MFGAPELVRRHGAPRLGPVGIAACAYLDAHLPISGVSPTPQIRAGVDRLAELIETLLRPIDLRLTDDPERYAAASDTIRDTVRDALDSLGVLRREAVAGERLELWLSLVICNGLPANVLDAAD